MGKKRTNINNAYSSWEKKFLEYCKALYLGLFKIFLSDLLHIIRGTDFSSYAGGNTIYDSGICIESTKSSSCQKLLGIEIDKKPYSCKKSW